MDTLATIRGRLNSFLSEARRIHQSEFPYEHGRAAVAAIISRFEQHDADLQRLTQQHDRTVVDQLAAVILAEIVRYLPLLGFLLRSTNTRNAFELHGPLQRLARLLLGEQTRLVLSSEWSYSPLAYTQIPHLPGFVLIGLPAPESANPMLFPLAGHELGHPVWRARGLAAQVAPRLQAEVTRALSEPNHRASVNVLHSQVAADLVAQKRTIETIGITKPILELAAAQCEERFCDFMGVRMFGASYLHAFAYLLAPNIGGRRPLKYDNFGIRGRQLVRAASFFGVAHDAAYADRFVDVSAKDYSQAEQFQVAIADEVSSPETDALLIFVRDICAAADVPLLLPEQQEANLERLRRLVPTGTVGSLGDVLCAGWSASVDPDLWHGLKQIPDRDAVLKELLLKSCEVLDLEQIGREGR